MIYLILAMLLYAVTIMLGSAASRHANTNLAAAIMNTISAIIPIAVATPLIFKRDFQGQKFGMLMSVLTGVAIAFFVMSLNKAYALNKVGIVTPVVFGGAIFLSTALSYFIFKEKLSLLEAVGLGVLGIGFIILTYARATTK